MKSDLIITSVEALTDVGQALYGKRWQRQLAADLHVDERQIRRWLKGDALLDPSGIVLHDALWLLEQKIEGLYELHETLHKWHLEATSKQLIYDTAVQLIALDESIATSSYKRFCTIVRHAVSADELGMTKEQFERALQGAWEKVHI